VKKLGGSTGGTVTFYNQYGELCQLLQVVQVNLTVAWSLEDLL
jgi:hypothetical protein